jgi:hypothetical protein
VELTFLTQASVLIPLYVSFCFALFLYLSNDFIHHLKKYSFLIINLAAGFLFAYMFLTLLPDIYRSNASVLIQAGFFFTFIGYISFYLAEKHIFSSKKSNTQKELLAIRTGGFYLVHFITGFIIVYSFSIDTFGKSLTILIPFLLHNAATMLLYEDLTKWLLRYHHRTTLVFPGLVMLGAISAIFLEHTFGISSYYFYAFFGGTFMYLITTIMTPGYHKGYLNYFLAGIIAYVSLILVFH